MNIEQWNRWRTLLTHVARSAEEMYVVLHRDGESGLLEEWVTGPADFVFVKGSFDPIHCGHVAMLDSSVQRHPTGEAAFSLSLQTAKRPLTVEEIAARSRLIHAAGYPVVITRSGLFAHDAAFFRSIGDIRLIFPVGADVVHRLMTYFAPREFARLFSACVFEYYERAGSALPAPERLEGYQAIRPLAEIPLPQVSSSTLRQWRAEGKNDQVRSLMPAAAAELFLEEPGIDFARREEREEARGSWWSFITDRPPYEIVQAEGAYLQLRDGRRVLDAAGSSGVVNVGHGRAEVVEAMARSARQVSYAMPGFATPDRIALAARLQEKWLPPAFRSMHLTASGSDAMEAAIMLARKYQVATGRLNRWKVIGRPVSYHGATLATLAIGGHDQRRAGLSDLVHDPPRAPACYCLRCPLGLTYPDCGIECARSLENLIDREGAETIAAFVLEPVVGASGGAIVPPDKYWRTVSEICRRHHILVVADEVTTGFGRTGRRFAFEHWDGPAPDMLVVGKGLTSGYAPLAALFTTEEIAARVAAVRSRLPSHTFDGHSAACAAANAVLEIFEREQLLERVAAIGPIVGGSLADRLKSHPHVAEVRGRGLLWGVEIVRDRDSLSRFPRHAQITRSVVRAGLERGVFFYPGGTGSERDIIVISPPFVIGAAEAERIASVLEEAIDEAVSSV